MLDRFLSTFSIVSRVPVKLPFKFDSSRMDFYLPLIGIFPALMGLILFVLVSFFFNLSGGRAPAGIAEFPPGIPALITLLILIAQYLGFNLFHLDGLMDTADAFLGGGNAEKRREILKDSRVGVYGFFAGAAALALKAVLVYSLLPFARDFPALTFSWPLWGRFGAALVPCMAKPLNSGSLGALAEHSRPRRCFLGTAAALLLWTLSAAGLAAAARTIGIFPPSAAFDPFPALIAAALCLFVICPLSAFFYARLYTKSLGGYTGDAMGAAIESAEVLSALTALALLSWAGAP